MAANTKAAQAENNRKLMETLRELGGQIHGDDTIVHHDGKQIMIPKGMELLTLHKVVAEEDPGRGAGLHDRSRPSTTALTTGSRAVRNVLRDHFGWATGMATQVPSSGPIHRELVTIDVGVGRDRAGAYGDGSSCPPFEGGKIHLGADRIIPSTARCSRSMSQVQEEVRGQDRRTVQADPANTSQTDSIYRGKAITAR